LNVALNLICTRLLQTFRDFAAVLIGLYGDALHVDSGSRGILMIERLLGLDETAGLLGDDARVGVPGLM
jgi:hypothetical protein